MRITIIPNPQGVSAEVDGVQGSGCSSEVSKILRHLTTSDVQTRAKPEFYAPEPEQREAE